MAMGSEAPIEAGAEDPPAARGIVAGVPDAGTSSTGGPAKASAELDAAAMAPLLIGATLLVDGVGGVIVETEAYTRDDPASHSFRGPGRANAAMFGPSWHVYVYRSYGLHWCLNIVAAGGGAVLIRALQPHSGIEEMARRRGTRMHLCAGPGRLAEALGVTGAHNGLSVRNPPFLLIDREGAPPIVRGPRIGISRARETPWRFGLEGSRYLSRPFPRSADEASGSVDG